MNQGQRGVERVRLVVEGEGSSGSGHWVSAPTVVVVAAAVADGLVLRT